MLSAASAPAAWAASRVKSERSVATISAAPARRAARIGQHADRAAAGDKHAFAKQFAGLAHRMQADRQRFGHRGLAGREPVGGHALAGIGDEGLTEGALNMRERHRGAVKAHVHAVVWQAFVAVAAWPQGREGETATSWPLVRLVTPSPSASNMARDLVAEDHRFLQAHGAEAAVVVIVQIAAADAACRQTDQNLAGAGCGRVLILDPQIPGGVDDDGFHADPFVHGRDCTQARGRERSDIYVGPDQVVVGRGVMLADQFGIGCPALRP